jgi:hypothetical protein
MAEMGCDHLAVGVDMRGYNLSSKLKEIEQYRMQYLVGRRIFCVRSTPQSPSPTRSRFHRNYHRPQRQLDHA